MERYYNRKRIHSALNDLSPIEFRKKYCITMSVFSRELHRDDYRKLPVASHKNLLQTIFENHQLVL
ncbi:IS3 family transposase [Leptospira interrogans]|uniref:IS3 family transposase n=1 Tax=Leptospira interrogans TaxID=173 RepID=UPI0039914969